MELRVIGCWAPYPQTGEACSGYLIKEGKTTCLVDCGHGVMSCLGKHIDPFEINLVVISHFHPDHYVDLHAFRHLIRGGRLQGKSAGPVDLYIPDQPRDQFEYWQSVPEFTVYPIHPRQKVSHDELNIEFYPVSHPLPTYGLKCRAGKSSLFYSSDAAASDEMWENARETDILLGEASFLAADGELAHRLGHMTTSDLARGALRARPGILVATHLWPGFDRSVLFGEIQSVYSGQVIMAYCGLKISI
jgi:ribonuclease BN (tRNA processing enzyme)